MIHHGDNIEVMRGMDAESVDLIATDPPFNTGMDFGDYNDRWVWDDERRAEYATLGIDEQLAVDVAHRLHSYSMGAFCCFLSVRLLEMHRLLKPTGSIYIHCDQTANSYIRLMLDAIFGARNFRNEIVWHYQPGTKPKTAFGRKHDTIFWYTKSKDYWYCQQRQPVKDAAAYRLDDGDGRLYQWGNNKTIKYYLANGRACDDVWSWFAEPEFNAIASSSKERTGYPTQKPIALYERIIRASSPAGDIVLDPFMGSGTTLVAAKQLGRRYIGIDANEDAVRVARERLDKVLM